MKIILMLLLLCPSLAYSDKDLYIDDLINRFPGHTFTETITGALTKVEFKDGGSTVIFEATRMDVFDAYKNIRENLVGDSNILFLVTPTQRDALINTITGRPVWNDNQLITEVWDGVEWMNTAGSSVGSNTFGSMYENNLNGSAMNSSTHRWNTATEGPTPTGATFSKDSTGDKFTITTAGSYYIAVYASFTNEGGKPTTATILVDGVPSIITTTIQGDSSKQRAMAVGDTLVLSIGDVITLEIVSESASDVVKVYQCHVNLS